MSDPQSQVHDFEPGILASGLFWTVPISRSAISAQPRRGRARFAATNMALPDFHDFGNAVSPAPASTPGHVSFDVRWERGGPVQKITDTTFGFAGEFIPSVASIRFAVSDDGNGVTYKSDDAGQVTVGGGVGKERNGVFFQCDTTAATNDASRIPGQSCWSK